MVIMSGVIGILKLKGMLSQTGDMYVDHHVHSCTLVIVSCASVLLVRRGFEEILLPYFIIMEMYYL